MKKALRIIAMFFACSTIQAEIASYPELVESISNALQNKEILRSSSFTNEVVTFAESTTNELHLVTAKFGVALAFLEMAESSMEDVLYTIGLDVVTNTLQSQSCPMTAWQRYAGMSILCDYLNYDSKYAESLAISTNAIALIDSYNPTLENPNFWLSLTLYDGIQGASLKQAFQVNAAGACIMSGDFEGVGAFTNGLPQDIMESLLELIGN